MLPTHTTNITGFSDLVTRIELPAGIKYCLFHDARLKKGASLVGAHSCRHRTDSAVLDCAPHINKCSTIGPSASAGTNVSAPIMMITPISSATKSGAGSAKCPPLEGYSSFSPRHRRAQESARPTKSGRPASRCHR